MTEVRYRAEVYIDVWVEEDYDKIREMLTASRIAEEFASLRPNSFVTDVFKWEGLLKLNKGVN